MPVIVVRLKGFKSLERRIEKVFKIDEYSAMAITGAAGPCIEMAKLFQVELERWLRKVRRCATW